MRTQTKTYVELDISSSAFKEIFDKLNLHGYDHLFKYQGDAVKIDMEGIVLSKKND